MLFPFRLSFMYFNPRSDERSDLLCKTSSKVSHISIHAPTNGATTYTAGVVNTNVNFNPRSDERSDQYCNLNHQLILISIHAPTNGATRKRVI